MKSQSSSAAVLSWTLTLLVLLSPILGYAAEPSALPVQTLEEIVREYVKVRSQLSHEKGDWEEKKTALRSEIALLKTEQESLQKEIDRARELQGTTQEDRAAWLKKKEILQAAVAKLPPILDRAEAELRLWQNRIPPSLLSPLQKAFKEIPAGQQDADRLGLAKRLQLVIALYTQIEKLQQGIHVVKEILTIEGSQRREMDVLYLGLAQAFAVSPDDQVAAVGLPGKQRWTWTSHRDIAFDIRKGIGIFNRERTAALVDLPLQVTGRIEKP